MLNCVLTCIYNNCNCTLLELPMLLCMYHLTCDTFIAHLIKLLFIHSCSFRKSLTEIKTDRTDFLYVLLLTLIFRSFKSEEELLLGQILSAFNGEILPNGRCVLGFRIWKCKLGQS